MLIKRCRYTPVGYGFAETAGSGVVRQAGLFGLGSGLKLTKISSLMRAWDVLFVLGVQKYNQNKLGNIAKIFQTYLNFRVFSRHDLGFKLVFRFGPEVVGPFTTLAGRGKN